MGWLKSRRLHYWLGCQRSRLCCLHCCRWCSFSAFRFRRQSPERENAVLTTLGIGFRFDLRLAILVMLPLAVLAWILAGTDQQPPRSASPAYLVAILGAVLLIYIIDFGHYAYLGVRINATGVALHRRCANIP